MGMYLTQQKEIFAAYKSWGASCMKMPNFQTDMLISENIVERKSLLHWDSCEARF